MTPDVMVSLFRVATGRADALNYNYVEAIKFGEATDLRRHAYFRVYVRSQLSIAGGRPCTWRIQ